MPTRPGLIRRIDLADTSKGLSGSSLDTRLYGPSPAEGTMAAPAPLSLLLSLPSMPAVLIEYLHQHDVERPVSRGESVACRPSTAIRPIILLAAKQSFALQIASARPHLRAVCLNDAAPQQLFLTRFFL